MTTPTSRTKPAIRAVPTTDSAKKVHVPPSSANRQGDYVVPLVHLHVPERRMNLAFWSTLAAAAIVGVVDLPVAALVGGAVFVARHHARTAASVPG